MDEEPIYEIYVMEKPYYIDEYGFPACGAIERVGYYYEEETALRAVQENWCSIQDHYARAAEIRKVEPGLYPKTIRLYYFLWNSKTKKFEESEFIKWEGWLLS